MKQFPEAHRITSGAAGLQDLCACLGQIPLGQEPISSLKIPKDWDRFSEDDWEQLISKAYIEGLAPLLYWILLKSKKIHSIPESASNLLRRMYSGTWMNNELILKELEALTQAFMPAEIPLVVLKGASFILTIYPDIGLRPMADMDILVPGSKLSEAVSNAKSLGYMDLERGPKHDPRNLQPREITLKKTNPQEITLELHRGLLADPSSKFAIPVNWFWAQTEPIDGFSNMGRFENLQMLTPAAQILYAVSHAMLQHGGYESPLRWFYDLDRLVRFYGGRLDWNLLLKQARVFEWGSALEAALSRTAAYFNTPIPGHVLTSLSGISDQNRKFVTFQETQPATIVQDAYQRMLSLKGKARFRYLLARIVPSPAYMFHRYELKSMWSLPAHYLFRWWWIIKELAHSVIVWIKKKIIL